MAADYEVVNTEGDFDIIHGSTPYQAALVFCRELKKFEKTHVVNLETKESMEIDGAELFSLAYLDNNCPRVTTEEEPGAWQNSESEHYGEEWLLPVESC